MNPADESLETLMGEAVAYSLEHVQAGGLPFVGVVTNGSYTSDFGVNKVHQTGDPSAHAEIVAMRQALHDLQRTDLAGMRLLATGEPCALCYRFALNHGITSIYVAVDAETVATHGFDYRNSYSSLGLDTDALADLRQMLPVTNGLEPFTEYLLLHHPEALALFGPSTSTS